MLRRNSMSLYWSAHGFHTTDTLRVERPLSLPMEHHEEEGAARPLFYKPSVDRTATDPQASVG